MDLREYCQKEQNTLWDESRRLVNPQKVYVDLSQKLYDLKKNLLEEMSEKALDWSSVVLWQFNALISFIFFR